MTFDQNANNVIVWPYRRNPDYLVVVVGEGKAGRSLGVGLCRRMKEHLVIFTDAYEFDTLYSPRRERFVWDAFARHGAQTRCAVKERLGALGFDPCVVDRLWPETKHETSAALHRGEMTFAGF